MNSGASDLRLLQAIAGGEHGGAEAFFVRLALALARAGVDQHVLVRGGRPWVAALREGGLHPLALPFGGWADVTTRRAFFDEIDNMRDRIIAHMRRDPFEDAERLRSYPAAVAKVLRAATARDPKHRPSPLEFAKEFAAAL